MSQIKIQNEIFKIGDEITSSQFQALVNAIKEKNSFATYCEEVTEQVNSIESTLKSQYQEIVRDLKTKLTQTNDTLGVKEKQSEYIIELEHTIGDLEHKVGEFKHEVDELEHKVGELGRELDISIEVEMDTKGKLDELKDKMELLSSKLELLSSRTKNSISLDIFDIYETKVNEVIKSIDGASSSIQTIHEEIQVMSETRIEVFNRLKNSTMILDDPGVTDLRHETSEVQNFQTILAQMAEKKQKVRELPDQIRNMVSELQTIWEDSESVVLQDFGKRQHQLLQALMRWKMEIEPRVFS